RATSERVQNLLRNAKGEEKFPGLFCELDELQQKNDSSQCWRETARWIRFEELVEPNENRWSKPHVAVLKLFDLDQLRRCLENAIILLDMQQVSSIHDIAEKILIAAIKSDLIPRIKFDSIKALLVKPHRYMHYKEKKPSLALTKTRHHSNKDEIDKQKTKNSQATYPNSSAESNSDSMDEGTPLKNAQKHRYNMKFMKKVAPGSESASLLIGETDMLSKSLVAFVRLQDERILGDLTEVPLPTRFVFLVLVPKGNSTQIRQIARSMAAALADEVFKKIAYLAESREDLLAGLDEFAMNCFVIPPSMWNSKIRLDPPETIDKQTDRPKVKKIINFHKEAELEVKSAPHMGRRGSLFKKFFPSHYSDSDHTSSRRSSRTSQDLSLKKISHADETLKYTGRIFGGLVQDIKRRAPHYASDFKDALNTQCFGSLIFIYFACLTPIVTFGGLLAQETGGNLGTIESILSGAIVGVLYALFSGQPLTILGSTGPVLVFEKIVYTYCSGYGLHYLSMRFWIGMWTAAFLLLAVAFDLSFLVKYITRFTEEAFAALIVLLQFIDWEAISEGRYSWEGYKYIEHCESALGSWNLDSCKNFYVPDVLLFSFILFVGTFLVSLTLKRIKFTSFFPEKMRSIISDFGVVLAIVLFTTIDYFVGIHTPKLLVPAKFEPTLGFEKRGWLVYPFNGNPWWTALLAMLPALLSTILLFMDQQITAVIINRPENMLVKGAGYHLDLLVMAVTVAINSALGIPWFVAATVLSINHLISLRVDSETTAPGEKPTFLGFREQRVTALFIFAFIGLSSLYAQFLANIPMPVLYGVFLYMGLTTLQ
ncbi:Sodium bicarbonate cotransporter 3, partial [Cichlidogyrus casuarinus]